MGLEDHSQSIHSKIRVATVNQWLADTFSSAFEGLHCSENIPISREVEEILPQALRGIAKEIHSLPRVINSGRGLEQVISAWTIDLPPLVIAG